MIVADAFSKMAHFIACKKIVDAINIVGIFLHKIVQLLELPRSLTLDHEVKFVSFFWKELWRRLKPTSDSTPLAIHRRMEKHKLLIEHLEIYCVVWFKNIHNSGMRF